MDSTTNINFAGSEEWTAALAQLTALAGEAGFADDLFSLLDRWLNVDHVAVFALSPHTGPGHLFTRSKMPAHEAQSLSDDYANKYYERDPVLAAMQMNQQPVTRPLASSLKYDSEYLAHFFSPDKLVDKLSMISDSAAGSVYCNYYRMAGNTPFADSERKTFANVLTLLTSLISHHYALVQPRNSRMSQQQKVSANRLIEWIREHSIQPFDLLTARESEVCKHILAGLSSKQIAVELNIALTSVNTYRRRAYEKLEINSQNELFAICVDSLSLA